MATAGAGAVRAQDFLAYVADLNAKRVAGDDVYGVQFQALVEESSELAGTEAGPTQVAFSAANLAKNRTKDAVPFDQNRVVLEALGSVTSDYINASPVKGTGDHGDYIATQAPLPHTVVDFWRLVQQTKVSVILGLAHAGADTEPPSVKYWLDQHEALAPAGLEVTVHSEMDYDDFVLRTLILKCSAVGTSTWVYHLDHTHWPTGLADCNSQRLMEFFQFVDHYQGSSSGPLLVHSINGAGRTGTLIALDMVRRVVENEGMAVVVDIYGTVALLRQQRMKMVETVEQYRLLHVLVGQVIQKGGGTAADGDGSAAAGPEAVADETTQQGNSAAVAATAVSAAQPAAVAVRSSDVGMEAGQEPMLKESRAANRDRRTAPVAAQAEEGQEQSQESTRSGLARAKSTGKSAGLLKRTSAGMKSLLGGSSKKGAGVSQKKAAPLAEVPEGGYAAQITRLPSSTTDSASVGKAGGDTISTEGTHKGPSASHRLSMMVGLGMNKTAPTLERPRIPYTQHPTADDLDWNAAYQQRDLLSSANDTKAAWPDLSVSLAAISYGHRFKTPLGPRPCPWRVA